MTIELESESIKIRTNSSDFKLQRIKVLGCFLHCESIFYEDLNE